MNQILKVNRWWNFSKSFSRWQSLQIRNNIVRGEIWEKMHGSKTPATHRILDPLSSWDANFWTWKSTKPSFKFSTPSHYISCNIRKMSATFSVNSGIVLHPSNVNSVLRYLGPTRTWVFSSFKVLLVRCTVCPIHTSLKKWSVSDRLCRLYSFLKSCMLHSSLGRGCTICVSRLSDAQH